MALFGSGGERWSVPVSGREDVVDVSGAGDTVAAVFGLALAAGRPAEDAMAIANAAAGLVVLERGTVAPDRRRLVEALERAPRAERFAPAGEGAPERRR
jgi:D-beta-D-heptose 7-phosphate kinase/D-beta-D-heptose 1-phosphate adenosyltransferase